MQENQTKL